MNLLIVYLNPIVPKFFLMFGRGRKRSHDWRPKNRSKLVKTNCDGFCKQSFQRIAVYAKCTNQFQLCPVFPGNSGALNFPHSDFTIPGFGSGIRLPPRPISPGHLTMSLFPPYSIVAFFNDQFIGQHGKDYCRIVLKGWFHGQGNIFSGKAGTPKIIFLPM